MNISIEQLSKALREMADIVDKTSAPERFGEPACLEWKYTKTGPTTDLDILVRIHADGGPAISTMLCCELAWHLGLDLCQSPANLLAGPHSTP